MVVHLSLPIAISMSFALSLSITLAIYICISLPPSIPLSLSLSHYPSHSLSLSPSLSQVQGRSLHLRRRRLCFLAEGSQVPAYRGTSLKRKRTTLGPYRSHMPRVIGRS